MVSVNQRLAVHLLSLENQWTDQRRLDVITSFVMIGDKNDDLFAVWRKLHRDGRFRVDSKLIADIYFACPTDWKLTIIGSIALPHVDPSTFRNIFEDAWRISPITLQQRSNIAGALRGFLYLNPKRASEYEELVLDLAWSLREDLYLYGVDMLRFMDDLRPEDLVRLKQRLQSRREVRMSALNVCCEWVKRHEQISPELLAFCTSPEVNAIARKIASQDPDKDARTCAYYLLMALWRYDEAIGAGPFKDRPRPKGTSR